MKEEWKPLKENPDYYEISNIGRIRSTGMVNRYGFYKRPRPKYLSYVIVNGGYVACKLSISGESKRFLVHRLVVSNFIGDIGDKEVNHKDGNKANNSVENLEICTRSYNMWHAWNVIKTHHGLTGVKGEQNALSRRVVRYDANMQNPVVYGSVRQAAIELGYTNSRISQAARSGRKYKNYYWSYNI